MNNTKDPTQSWQQKVIKNRQQLHKTKPKESKLIVQQIARKNEKQRRQEEKEQTKTKANKRLQIKWNHNKKKKKYGT